MNFETSNAKGVQMHTEVLRGGLLKSLFHIMPQQRPHHIRHKCTNEEYFLTTFIVECNPICVPTEQNLMHVSTQRASKSGLRGWRVSRILTQDFVIVLEDSLTLGMKEINEIFVWMYMLIWWEMICSRIFYMLCDSVSGDGDLLACVIKPLVWREQVGLPCIALTDTLWLMKEGHFSWNSCSSMFQLADSQWWPKNTTTKNNIWFLSKIWVTTHTGLLAVKCLPR